MKPLFVREKHIWALTRDDRNAMIFAELQCLRTDRALAAGAIHPDAGYVQSRALLHNLVGHRGRCHDEHAVDRRRNFIKAGETGSLVRRLQCGIDGNRLVSAFRNVRSRLREKSLGSCETPTIAMRFCARKS